MQEHCPLTVHVTISSLRSPPPPPRPLGATVGAETQPHTKRTYLKDMYCSLVDTGFSVDLRLSFLIVYWFTCLIYY